MELCLISKTTSIISSSNTALCQLRLLAELYSVRRSLLNAKLRRRMYYVVLCTLHYSTYYYVPSYNVRWKNGQIALAERVPIYYVFLFTFVQNYDLLCTCMCHKRYNNLDPVPGAPRLWPPLYVLIPPHLLS